MKKKRWLLLIAMLIAVMMFPLTANAAVKLNKTKVTLTVGKTVQLKVKGTKNKVNWSSTNKNVAAVNKKGKVSAKSAGSATIKAKVGKMTLKCKVTVNAPVTPAPAPAPAPTPTPTPESSLSASSIELIAGQQKQLTLNNASGNVTWSSSNFRIADVASDGTVYAKFYGTCVVKATCGGKSYTCKVSVTLPNPECYPKTGLTLSQYNVDIRIDTFKAEFVSFQPNTEGLVVLGNESYWYFNPCKYRIHMKGHIQKDNNSYANNEFSFFFTHMWMGRVNDADEYTECFIKDKTDVNGDFDITKEVMFNSPAEIIYLISW